MRRSHLGWSLLPLACGATLAGACTQEAVGISLAIRAPQLLDEATAVRLQVINAEAAQCDGLGGITGTVTESDVQTFDLEKGACASGAVWCKEITLDKDDSTKTFHVLVSESGVSTAQGCAQAVIDQDPLEVRIDVQRFVTPKCCGNGQIDGGEQCDTGALADADCGGNPPAVGQEACVGIFSDFVCECDCLAKEIVVSPEGGPPALTNDPQTKEGLALAFAGTSGQVAGALHAVYTDLTVTASPDINITRLQGSFYPFDSGLEQLSRQLRLSTCANPLAPNGAPRQQRSPDIAQLSNDTVAVVYASDEVQATRFDIFLSEQGPNGCADSAPIQVNVRDAGNLASATLPSVARGPSGKALIVWQEEGSLIGRILDQGGNFDGQNIDIGTIATDARPRVAGSESGWLVAYQNAGEGDGEGVFTRRVDINGSVGSETRVNNVTDGVQNEPDVAMLPDGRACVVWHSGSQIWMQRFDTNSSPVEGDQEAPVSGASPPGGNPKVASGGIFGDFFALAWVANGDQVWGRFAGGSSGFGFNAVDGQNTAYLASHPAVLHARVDPAIAVGGEGVAIGWYDTTAEPVHGMIIRKFPLPSF